MTFARTLAGASTALALVIAPVAPALAQQTAPAPAPAPAPQMDLSDEKVESFVMAALGVSEVVDEYQPRIEAAEDDAARQGLATEAQEAMIGAVQDTDGITVEEYVSIGEAASADPALNERIMQRMQSMQQAD